MLSDCPGSTEKVISHLFLHKPTVNIQVLNSKSNLKNEYIYPSQETNAVQGTIHIQFFILYIFIFVSVCIYSCYFSEKITSACKKLNRESEHKNFLYTYSWTCHVLLIQMLSDHLQKKNIEILETNYKTKPRNASFPCKHNIYRDVYLPTHCMEKKMKNLNKTCMHMTSCHIAKNSVSTSQGSLFHLMQKHIRVQVEKTFK